MKLCWRKGNRLFLLLMSTMICAPNHLSRINMAVQAKKVPNHIRTDRGLKKGKQSHLVDDSGIRAEVHSLEIDPPGFPVRVDAIKDMYDDVVGEMSFRECRPRFCMEYDVDNKCIGNHFGFDAVKCLGENICGEQCPPQTCTYDEVQDIVSCPDQTPKGTLKQLFGLDPGTDDNDVPSEFMDLNLKASVDCLEVGTSEAPDANKDGKRRETYAHAIVSATITNDGYFPSNMDEGMVVTYAVRVGAKLSPSKGGVASYILPCHFVTYEECRCVADYVKENSYFPEQLGQCWLTSHSSRSRSGSHDAPVPSGFVECPYICQDQQTDESSDIVRPMCQLLDIAWFEKDNNVAEGNAPLFAWKAGDYTTTDIEIRIGNEVYSESFS